MPETTLRPVDLRLRIESKQVKGHTVFHFDLLSPSGRIPIFRRIEDGRNLPLDLERYSELLFSELENLRRRQSNGDALWPNEVDESLRNIGKELYERLLPPTIREIFDLQPPVNGSLLVETEETWIPWELLHTFGAQGNFLCQLYRMGRWLPEGAPPRGAIRITRGLCIEAGEVSGFPQLPSAQLEAGVFSSLAERRGLHAEKPDPPTHANVMDQLRHGKYQILHFIGHGEFPETINGNRTALILADRKLVACLIFSDHP